MTERNCFVAEDRFPNRRFLSAVARDHGATARTSSVDESLQQQLRERWAQTLGVATDDLVLVTTRSDAWNLLCRALLVPGDVALIAQPCAVALPAAIVAAGASFVDVGRRVDGHVDQQTAARALRENQAAIACLQAPNLSGSLDHWPADSARPRAVLVDACHAARHSGATYSLSQGADVAVITLRDPDSPGQALLHAAVCKPGTGHALSRLTGPSMLPHVLLRQSLATLAVIADRGDTADERLQARLVSARNLVAKVLDALPNLLIQHDEGMSLLIWCLDGDVRPVVSLLGKAGFTATGHGAHPMRSTVAVDLASWVEPSR